MNTLNLGTVAHIRTNNINYRVEDHGSDYVVCCSDGTDYRWFSTHAAMSPRADITQALSSYLNTTIRQKQVTFL